MALEKTTMFINAGDQEKREGEAKTKEENKNMILQEQGVKKIIKNHRRENLAGKQLWAILYNRVL